MLSSFAYKGELDWCEDLSISVLWILVICRDTKVKYLYI